jgi:hypothetical protein
LLVLTIPSYSSCIRLCFRQKLRNPKRDFPKTNVPALNL